ncbi:MAG: hypothetical protein ACAH88_02695, partial [Roseimicrobium sp.]
RNADAGPVKMKLFFSPGENDPHFEDRYAEHFLNFDLAAKRIEFREKDPGYREPLLRALSEAAP